MPELRWILIAFGLVLLAAIYVWGRRSTKETDGVAAEIARPRPEPRFESGAVYEASDSEDSHSADSVVDGSDVSDREREPALVTVEEASESELDAPVHRKEREGRRPRIEPTFHDESVTAELPASEMEDAADEVVSFSTARALEAPTLSMSNAPSPRRVERRKIIALRLAAAPQRIPGAELKAALESESLQHGKYDVFHRLDDDGSSVFSVASMVEPGTFDPEKMVEESYPGVTLFAQLPGPMAGMLAFNELVACSRRLHAVLGGTLQDERGVPLTVHRIERIRQEIREFEHRPASEAVQR